MYSRIPKPVQKSSTEESSTKSRFAPRSFVVQPKVEEVKSEQEQTPDLQNKPIKENQYINGFPNPSVFRYVPPAPTPRVQMKLTIGQPGNKYEQEADRVAADVPQQINAPQTPSIQRVEISEKAQSGQPLIIQCMRTGTDTMNVANKNTALLELAQITEASDVNDALVTLAKKEKGVLKRYKREYEYNYLQQIADDATFQWPLTYLRGRAARKRGKQAEDTAISSVYTASKNNETFYVENENGEYEKDGVSFTARIPDVFTMEVVGDVKNVKYQSFDQQLQDFYTIAKQQTFFGEDRTVYESDFETEVTKERYFEIVVRSEDHPEGKTNLSPQLEAAADAIHYELKK